MNTSSLFLVNALIISMHYPSFFLRGLHAQNIYSNGPQKDCCLYNYTILILLIILWFGGQCGNEYVPKKRSHAHLRHSQAKMPKIMPTSSLQLTGRHTLQGAPLHLVPQTCDERQAWTVVKLCSCKGCTIRHAYCCYLPAPPSRRWIVSNAPVEVESGLAKIGSYRHRCRQVQWVVQRHAKEWGVVNNNAASDWFEVASANLNLGAYSFRVSPLQPRFLKQPLRKVSDNLAPRGQENKVR